MVQEPQNKKQTEFDRAVEITGVPSRNQTNPIVSKCIDNSGYVETVQNIKPKRSVPT